ncbi:MAG: hydroxyacid dehydrogenase [Clostridia bacterium]|nr:hydroxyacid dehydrogenase [Clostridia bacterium]
MNQKDFTVLITHAIPKPGLERLFEECKVFYPENAAAYTDEEMMALLPECDAVLAGGAMTRDMIACAKKLKIISNYGAGYDQVDVDAADEAGVIVTNIPDSTTYSTAELAFSLMLTARRRIAELDRMLRTQPSKNAFGMGRHMGHNLAGSTLGIIGMGRIGGRLAEMAKAFGMNVIYHNRRKIEGMESGWRSMDDLLAEADIISLNCPLTNETRGLIGKAEFDKMKPGAVIVNTSRGGVIDTDALIGALKSGRLGGAGIDVYPNEPEVPEELKTFENVVLTPHIGTNTHEARKGMAEAAAERIFIVRDGQTPPNIVNRNLRKA